LYPGREVEGRYVPSDAYAAVLGGSLAESTGDAKGAIALYEHAAELDPNSPEVASRIGATRCASNGRDPRADEAIRRALAIDAEYAPAWEAEATCSASRGDFATADRSAAHAWSLARAGAEVGGRSGALVPGALAAVPSESATTAVIERLTVTARDPAGAADAIARWASEHDDVPLRARALELELAVNPSARTTIAAAVDELAGIGRVDEARAVAAAIADADADGQPLSCAGCALAGRLAVDEAIARDDAATARRRATRVRLSLEELGARWLLAGRPERARAVARDIAAAEPDAVAARLLLETLGPSTAPSQPPGTLPSVSAATWIVWCASRAAAGSTEAARTALSRVPHDAVVAGDDLVLRAAVALAARGVVGERDLPADGVAELRALTWAQQSTPASGALAHPQAEGAAASVDRALDARHEFLRLATAHPKSPSLRTMAERLGRLAPSDRIVAAAAAIDAIQSGTTIDAGLPRRLLALDGTDPLLAAVALQLAVKLRDLDGARRAGVALQHALGRGALTE
jgi:SWI/SNF-related matrix-associated actin-dependent regulator 1 of chromatin subfamily A